MSMAQFWTLAQSKYISKGVQKWTLLGSKVVPPGGSVFGLFILSDFLKLCRLPCAQNVKLEATLTQTASAAGILNCSRPWLPPRGCYVMCDVDICNLIRTTRFKRVFEWASNRPQGGTGFRMSRAPVLDPCAKQMSFKRGPKVDPLRIESGPSWRVCFWPLYFVRFAEALQAAMCAKCQA